MQKFIFTILTIQLVSLIAFSQNPYYDDKDYNHLSITEVVPSVAEYQVLKHFNHPKCNGKIDVTLPIYTIKFGQAEIPIYLSYNTSGIKVNSVSPRVGQNWHLTAGGQITVVKKGALYDHENGTIPFDHPAGLRLSGWRNHNLTESYSMYPGDPQIVDLEPDLYFLTAPGLTTEFIISKDEKAIEIKGDDVKLKLEYNKFIVLSNSGIEYTFDHKSYGYEYIDVARATQRPVTNYYLTEMKYPSGEVITFAYDELGAEVLQTRKAFYMDKYKLMTENQTTQIREEGDNYDYKVQLFAKTRIRNIEFGSGKIEFNYNHARSDISGDYALSEIKVSFNNKKVKAFNLEYDYLKDASNNYSRLLLDNITVGGKTGQIYDEYTFEYNEGIFPKYDSYYYDYFGYYANNSQTDRKIKIHAYVNDDLTKLYYFPFQITGFDGNKVTFVNSDRKSVESDVKIGMLKRINYPTGGYLELEYESNEFIVLNNTIKGAGLRIRSQALKDENNNWIKEYKYYNPVVKLPRFAMLSANPYLCPDRTNLTERVNFIINYTTRYYDNQVNSELFDGSPVMYSRVEEIQQNNGTINYYYDVTLDENATPTFTNLKDYIPYTNNYLLFNPESGFPFMNGRTHISRRGTLLQKWYFNENSDPIKGELFEYTFRTYPEHSVSYGYQYKGWKDYAKITNEYPIYAGKLVLDIKYIVDVPNSGLNLQPGSSGMIDKLKSGDSYLWNNLIVKENRYIYENNLLVRSINSNQSNGSFTKTEFKYLSDFVSGYNYNECYSSSYSKVVFDMIDKYMINSLVEITTSNDSRVFNNKIYQYKNEDNNFVLSKGIKLGISNTINDLSETKLGIRVIGGDECFHNLEYDNRHLVEYTFKEYDSKGKILEYHKTNDINESFIWGYGGQYPIAKVENAVSNETFFTSFEGEEEDLMSLVIDDCVTTRSYSGDRSLEYTLSNPSQSIWERRYEVFKLKPVISGLPKRYRYSGWVYSNGPKAVVSLYFKKANGVYNSVGNANTTVTNQWIYVEGEYTLPATFDGSTVTDLTLWVYGSDNSGKIWFDDLRLYPADAQMTSYTYDPLVGMTSQTGPDNKKATYIYDDFGRLEFVKDHHGNVINKYTYHYKGEPVNEFTEDFVDLSVSRITCPTTVNDNETAIDVDVSIRNSGNLVSNACKLYIYISDDANLDAGDIKLAEQDVGTLINAYDRGYIINLTLPANLSLGTHYIIAKIDANDQNDESNEANNTMAGQFNYVETPSAILAVNKSAILFRNGVYSTTFNITSNVNWTILSSTWLTLSSNSGINNQTITVSGNEVLGDQTGTITISGGGITRTINVTQIGDPGGPGDPLQIE